MCNKAVEKDPWSLVKVPDNFKTQKMCSKAVKKYLYSLMNVPDRFKKQNICIEAVEKYPFLLADVSDNFKTQEKCNEAVRIEPIIYMFLTILKHRRCVTRQCATGHGCHLLLINIKLRGCATR